jgi:L-amino acid N-acyltransferase YncA
MLIRPAEPQDAAALAAIYGDACLHGLGTFEEAAPTAEEMAGRVKAVMDRGLPYLVAEVDGEVAGFAYAAPFRLRAAYRYTVEDSVYIHPAFKGRGVGKALLSRVIEACETMGLRQMVAVIGDSANESSIGLHRALGFTLRGSMPAVGYKHGRWVDIVFMQRLLNQGGASPPEGVGLDLHGH